MKYSINCFIILCICRNLRKPIGILLLIGLPGMPAHTAYANTWITKAQPTHINIGTGYTSWGVPLYASFDIWVLRNLTFGLNAQFRTWTYTTFTAGVSSLGIHGHYHFKEIFRLQPAYDVYAGGNFGVGYVPKSLSQTVSDFDTYSEEPFLGYFLMEVGAKYWFNRQSALFLEFVAGSYFGCHVGLTFNPFQKWR